MMDIGRLLFNYMEYNLSNSPINMMDYLMRMLNYTAEEAIQCIMCIKKYYEN